MFCAGLSKTLSMPRLLRLNFLACHRRNKNNSMFENRTSTERIALAKAKMERVLDHFLYLLELHANNQFVVYSRTLSAQIRDSFAANAFNVFQRSMHQIEIVRLSALWDNADPDKENISTVAKLVDNEKVIEELAEQTRANWANIQPPGLMNSLPRSGACRNRATGVEGNQRPLWRRASGKGKNRLNGSDSQDPNHSIFGAPRVGDEYARQNILRIPSPRHAARKREPSHRCCTVMKLPCSTIRFRSSKLFSAG